MDFNGMNYMQLEEARAKIDKMIGEKRAEALAELRADVEKMVEERGFTMPDLLNYKRPSKPAAIFIHPKNASLTWGGKGKKPLWLVRFLQDGGSLDQCRAAA